jgi:plastocyanin
VTVGNNFFRSDHNGTCNTAVDTVQAGTTVTWTWTGATSHSVRSQGTPSFPSSAVLTGSGQSYSVTFDTPGSYDYDCSIHASQMTGRIVVQ